MATENTYLESDPFWYKDAIIYQLHIKTFYDSDGDGVGDFQGLTQKLDYLKNLGISAIWLLPFYPSPLKDDGYDISDYYDVNPSYGTLRDFKEFLREAHQRKLRVITELVINHTSDQHPWFQRARHAKPDSNYRNYYVWSKTPDRYADARIIFKDFEQSNWTWDADTKAYYWHRFYSHQPDLNFDNPNVQKEIFRIADFWFGLGVDGLRLDAVPYLFERDGTNCENLPETHQFLQKLRKHIDAKFKDRMLLAEANQWPEDAAAYFGQGNESHMAFHFPIMPRIYMSVHMEDRFPLVDILEQTPNIPQSCQWAIFLRNHDELTLEMVTDEERDYMYRSYAKDARSKINLGIRRRLVPLLGNNRRKIDLVNILLFSLPGTPIIYYGDEIGMGDNRFLGDRDGVRTPMQWSPDRNAGFSRANPQELYLPVIIDSEYHYETINVETQDNNLSSSLWWMRRVIAMRKRFRAFSQGATKFLFPDNPKVLSFVRCYGDEIMLVVINLSRFAQAVELDLKEYRDYVPEEVFSQNAFPTIKDIPYMMTLGPYSHFWFLLKRTGTATFQHIEQSGFRVENSWEEVFLPEAIHKIEAEILPEYLNRCRWFGGKARLIRTARFSEIIPLEPGGTRVAFVNVQYVTGAPETYLLPISFVYTKEDKYIARDYPQSIICKLIINGTEGFLFDGIYDQAFHQSLFRIIAQKRKITKGGSLILGLPGKDFKSFLGDSQQSFSSRILKAEQSNTAIVFDNKFFMKSFRKLEEGINPDIEISRYLSEQKKFTHTPPFAGSIEYRRAKAEPMALCVLQGYVQVQSDAWGYTTDQIRVYFDRVLVKSKEKEAPNVAVAADGSLPTALAMDLKLAIDPFYIEMIKLLGQRTAEMHQQLAAQADQPDFEPEPFSSLYQRSVYQSMGSQARLVLSLLRKKVDQLPDEIQREVTPILEAERDIYDRFKVILQTKFKAKRIRVHGDYHLGQVLFTGKDFMIIDFEGEPARSLSERRIKRSALRDIAGMLRSFHYAAYATLFLNKSVREVDVVFLDAASEFWYDHISQIFLQSYFATIGSADFLPKEQEELNMLLQVYLLDKAVYELGYELNNRPQWMMIPARGIRYILNHF
nr:maltose alpha-D-glucosyltransferase [Candidatus Omnitrophota bacterium]